MERFLMIVSFSAFGFSGILATTYNSNGPVVNKVPRLDRCSADNTNLTVYSYLHTYSGIPSFSECQEHCQALGKCTHFVYDYKDSSNLKCRIIEMKSFGTNEDFSVIGHGVCPKNDSCIKAGVDYYGGNVHTKNNVESPKDCQELCRGKANSVAFAYGVTKTVKKCHCKDYSFQIRKDNGITSGAVDCPHCFDYDYTLNYLQNVYNGGGNPFLTKTSVEACQESCKGNPKCSLFQFVASNDKCYHKNERTAEKNESNLAYASRDCDISCNCNSNGVIGGDTDCNIVGDCKSCKKGYTGKGCFDCKPGYSKDGTLCKDCGCKQEGSEGCDSAGNCKCKGGFAGEKCDQRKPLTTYDFDFGESVKSRYYSFKCGGKCGDTRFSFRANKDIEVIILGTAHNGYHLACTPHNIGKVIDCDTLNYHGNEGYELWLEIDPKNQKGVQGKILITGPPAYFNSKGECDDFYCFKGK